MKVRFKRHIEDRYYLGQEIDLPRGLANRYLALDWAEDAALPAPAQKVMTFLVPFGLWSAGETAGFSDDECAILLRAGLAKPATIDTK